MINMDALIDYLRRHSFLIVILIYFAFNSIKILKEDERLAIFRMGQFKKVVGPGLIFLLPAIDKGIKVNLTEIIPGWQGCSQPELEQKIKEYINKGGSDRHISP